jgi:DNA uptake protein ComE-like DNA-binding protein
MKKYKRYNGRRGIVLLITLVVLVVLASMSYVLTTRVASQVHRDQYLIDYQNARYACDSGLKYAMATLESGITAKLIDRPNDIDFSDVFSYTQEEYERFLEEWAAAHPPKDSNDQYDQYGQYEDANSFGEFNRMNRQFYGDMNDSDMAGYFQSFGDMNDANFADLSQDPNTMAIPGPYGQPWPLAAKPIELEIGEAKVTIEIEDENAKLPLIWGTNTDKEQRQEVDAAIDTFCEWMNMSFDQIDAFKQDLQKIGEIKPYKAGSIVMAGAIADANSRAEPNTAKPATDRRSRRRPAQPAQQPTAPQAAKSTADTTLGDFVRLCNSSKINLEPFAQPYIKTEQRTESALKYMSRWGATQVNVNTAPRQVLEAAFMFGGDAPKVAEAIIKERQQKPFVDVNDLQKKLYKYADSIRKSKDFITAKSNVFSIKITAVCGVAQTTTTAAVVMQDKKPKAIVILSQ